MATNAERQARWAGRQRATERRPITAWVPRAQADTLAHLARQHRLSVTVLVEAALEGALRGGGILSPPTLRVKLIHRERRDRARSLLTAPESRAAGAHADAAAGRTQLG